MSSLKLLTRVLFHKDKYLNSLIFPGALPVQTVSAPSGRSCGTDASWFIENRSDNRTLHSAIPLVTGDTPTKSEVYWMNGC